MDRRKRKSKEAIVKAFTTLLTKKSFSAITVGEIIELADVGRATFYAHFETKDYLLRELCSELFEHLLESDEGLNPKHKHIFNCDENTPLFLHLFKHIKNNDNNILTLLKKEDTGLFIDYFKNSLISLIEKRFSSLNITMPDGVPKDYFYYHVASCFLESASWWIKNDLILSPEQIYEYFLLTV